MAQNESTLDRTLRVIVGSILVIAWIAGWLTGVWAAVLGIVGVILILTGVVGFCPAYRLFKVSTGPSPRKE